MSVVQRVLRRPVNQFPERNIRRVLQQSTGLFGQFGQGFENGIHLDFANDFHYLKVAGQDPRIAPFTSLFTFTGDALSLYRGSNGNLRASATNTPRIEYDVNGKCLGILIEAARTNLCIQSQDLATSWINDDTTESANTIASPSGIVNADTLIEGSGSATHGIIQNCTVTANTTLTASVFVKAKERTKGFLQFMDAATNLIGFRVFFDLTAGTLNNGVSITTGTYTGSTITAYANGWYRVTLIGNMGGVITAGRVYVALATVDGTTSYVGDGASGLYVWGAQVEQAAFVSSYIPTTTIAVARAADIPLRAVGSEYSTTIGTWVFEYDTANVTAINPSPFGVDDGGNNNRITNYHSSTVLYGTINAGGVSQFLQNVAGGLVINVMNKGGMTWQTNDAIAVRNGALSNSDASVTIPTVTHFRLGYGNSVDHLFGHIRRFDYWPERKLNAQLQGLTS